MAIAFNLLLIVGFGMVEFGQYFYVKHCFEAAVRDGGRSAILPTANQTNMVTVMTTTLAQANVTFDPTWLTVYDQTTSTTVTDVSQIQVGDQVKFTLSTNYGNISNVMRPLYSLTGKGITNGKVVSATAVMVKE